MSTTINSADLALFPATARFPIALRAADPAGNQACYFVSHKDAQLAKYRTRLTISNTSGAPIRISKSESGAHFSLSFRPGLLNADMVERMLPSANALRGQLGEGWERSRVITESATGVMTVDFSFTGDTPFEWSQHDELVLELRPVPQGPLTGAFFVKVELDYSGITGGTPLALNLAAVDKSGANDLPLSAMVNGSNTVLNDGSTNHSFEIQLWPNRVHSSIPILPGLLDHESGTTITVAIRCAEEEDLERFPDVMGTLRELDGINLQIGGSPALPIGGVAKTIQLAAPSKNTDTPGWITWSFTPYDDTLFLNFDKPDSPSDQVLNALTFTLDNIISSTPNGLVNVYISFHHLPDYADHTIAVPLQKGPLVMKEQNVGIGTSVPPYKLTVESPEHGIAHTYGGVEMISWIGRSDKAAWLGTKSNHDFHLYTNNSGPGLSVKKGGNVQIKKDLSVTGKTSLGTLNTSGALQANGAVSIGTASDNADLALNGNAEISDELIVDGKVGIGIDEPLTKLHIVRGESIAKARTDTVLVLENDDDNYLYLYAPTDKNRGIYFGDWARRSAAGVVYQSHGTLELWLSSSAMVKVEPSGNVTATEGRFFDKNGPVMPIGSVIAYAGEVPPDGWLICDGSVISTESKYSHLRAMLGLGKRLPNLKGKFVMGVSPNNALNTIGGAATHTLTKNEMPKHSHGFTVQGSGGSRTDVPVVGNKKAQNFTTSEEGGGAAHNNLPPYQVLNYIIKY